MKVTATKDPASGNMRIEIILDARSLIVSDRPLADTVDQAFADAKYLLLDTLVKKMKDAI